MARKTIAAFGLSLAMALGAGTLVGCHDDPDTPGEAADRAGRKVERATDKAADKIEDAGDRIKDKLD